MRNLIDNYCEEHGLDDVLLFDGFDSAILGISSCFSSVKVVYSYKKIINILEKDMTHEEAVEYFEFNIAGAYVGEFTPKYLDKYE